MFKRRTSRVKCEVGEVELENEEGGMVMGVCARCTRCGHETESYRTEQNSILRCLVLMRQECPECESNFYFE